MKKTKTTKDTVSLSSPWQIYANKVTALFSGDLDVSVSLDDSTYTLNIVVDGNNDIKANAIRELFPETIPMGNITLVIDVSYNHIEGESSYADVVEAAFAGNTNFSRVAVESHGPLGPATSFGLFKNTTVHYYDDNLCHFKGFNTVIFADLASDLLLTPSEFYFSTDK